MIALITPTGGRLKQLELCGKFMLRQTYPGKVTWIIIDDVEPLTSGVIPDDFRPGWEIVRITPLPLWTPGGNTQARNLQVAIDFVKQMPFVYSTMVIEDDDYYAPTYIATMVKGMTGYDLIGEENTIYYNVSIPGWYQHHNTAHASLFQVAFSPAAIPILEEALMARQKFIDIEFFKRASQRLRVKLYPKSNLSIGIKGIAGRPGIGMGHSAWNRFHQDPKHAILRDLIGEDYSLYTGFSKGGGTNV